MLAKTGSTIEKRVNCDRSLSTRHHITGRPRVMYHKQMPALLCFNKQMISIVQYARYAIRQSFEKLASKQLPLDKVFANNNMVITRKTITKPHTGCLTSAGVPTFWYVCCCFRIVPTAERQAWSWDGSNGLITCDIITFVFFLSKYSWRIVGNQLTQKFVAFWIVEIERRSLAGSQDEEIQWVRFIVSIHFNFCYYYIPV